MSELFYYIWLICIMSLILPNAITKEQVARNVRNTLHNSMTSAYPEGSSITKSTEPFFDITEEIEDRTVAYDINVPVVSEMGKRKNNYSNTNNFISEEITASPTRKSNRTSDLPKLMSKNNSSDINIESTFSPYHSSDSSVTSHYFGTTIENFSLAETDFEFSEPKTQSSIESESSDNVISDNEFLSPEAGVSKLTSTVDYIYYSNSHDDNDKDSSVTTSSYGSSSDDLSSTTIFSTDTSDFSEDLSSTTETTFTTENVISTTEPSTLTTEFITETTTCFPGIVNVSMNIRNTTHDSIEIEWVVETNNDCQDIDSYEFNITWVNTRTHDVNTYLHTGDDEYVIEQLNACTEYNITIEILLYNISLASNSTTEETKTKVASAPEFKEALSVNKWNATFLLNIPIDTDNACEIESCTVDCRAYSTQRPNGYGTVQISSHSTAEVIVTGLHPYTKYDCVAYTTSRGVNSHISSSINITTPEDSPPAPEIYDITKNHNDITVHWEISEDIPGELQYFTVLVNYIDYEGTEDCDSSSESKNCTVNTTLRSCKVEGLKPYSLYEIMIIAATNGGINISDSRFVQTKPYVPEMVRDLGYDIFKDSENIWKARITWRLPCHTNGRLTNFIINYEGVSSFDNYSGVYNMSYSSPQENFTYEYELRPEYVYTVHVSPIVEGVDKSEKNMTMFESPSGIPRSMNPVDTHFKADPYATSEASQTLIIFNCNLFQYDGKITWYEIIVAQNGKEEASKGGLYNISDFPQTNPWSAVKNEDTVSSYRASPDGWMPFEGTSDSVATFLLGDNSCPPASNYCNGPLKPETTYVVKIRAFTGISNGGYQDSESIIFTTGSEIAVGMIVGILFAIIIIGFIAILAIMYRRGTLVWPPKFFKGSKQVTVRPQSILIKKFPAYCAQLLETPTRLSNEYQLLATLSVDVVAVNTCMQGQQPENRKKNRYINILPYDATRVTLDLLEGDPSSHYINASFIKGYTDDIEYIATQGPKEETCYDFWRMVYQHDVRVIVMVTNLVEQDKIKCYQYFPNLRENLTFDDITVRCTTEINFPIHTARTLILVKGDRKRTISHLHFREWPDFGVPQSTDCMLQFCQTMRHHAMAAELGLILVHCSAGVGRTGTLIAIDILLQHISENKKVDIFGTVFKLRKQRLNMVQTEGQYTYIYRCIKDAVEDPTIVNQRTTTNNSLEPIYENVGTTLNNLHYEKLPKWRRNKETV